MSDKTFHVTSEDLRKQEAQEAKYHGGQIPKDSDVSAMKVIPTVPSLLYTADISPSNS